MCPTRAGPNPARQRRKVRILHYTAALLAGTPCSAFVLPFPLLFGHRFFADEGSEIKQKGGPGPGVADEDML
jgi:hypothetical protein